MSALSDAAAYYARQAAARQEALDERDRIIAYLRTINAEQADRIAVLESKLAERTRDADAFHDEANEWRRRLNHWQSHAVDMENQRNEWRAKAQSLTAHTPSSLA